MPGELMVATDLRNLGNEAKTRGNLDYMGNQVVMDFFTWASLVGRVYQIQLGTEDAPVDSTAAMDDLLVWAVVDVPTGVKIMPVKAEAHIATFTTATLVNAMLEVDTAKVRYASGGTAATPLNLHTGKANASGCAAYVMEGAGVVTTAKTAGGSIEIARMVFTEDAITTSSGDEKPFIWNDRCPPVLEGPASIIFHFGATTADVTGYGLLKWIELP